MMKKMDIYGCSHENKDQCKVVAEILTDCEDACCLSCCNQPMEKLEAKTADSATEKHVPVVEKIDGGVKVTVGSVPHPMEAEHWIQMIELRSGNAVYRKFLDPGMAPEATFMVADLGDDVIALEHCNKHGLWRAE